MKLLRVISSVNPCGGGPIEGVRAIRDELSRLGHEVEILCLDSPDEVSASYLPGVVHALGPSKGSYRYNRKLVPWLKANAGIYDAVIVDGLWQYHAFATWRALAGTGIPYFVFAHGMLDPWFKRTYPLKHLKKWLYWPWADYRVLRDAAAVLFTCEEERLLARESFWLYRVKEAVVTYGTSDVPAASVELSRVFNAAFPEVKGKRVALYLGRLQEKKGCDLLIQAFAKVAGRETKLHLIMAGPDQTGWMSTLKKLAAKHGIADRVSWPGMLSGDLKWGAFHAAEVFCLPSHQENFGIVVAEALACSKPVLISNKVNIWREIEADGAGIVQEDTLEGTVQGLQRWLTIAPEARREMCHSARRCFAARFRIDRVAESLISILKKHVATNVHSRVVEGAAS